jgi:hypothetical protein
MLRVESNRSDLYIGLMRMPAVTLPIRRLAFSGQSTAQSEIDRIHSACHFLIGTIGLRESENVAAVKKTGESCHSQCSLSFC